MKKIALITVFSLALATIAYGYHGGGRYYDDGYYGHGRGGCGYYGGRGGYGHRYDDRYDRRGRGGYDRNYRYSAEDDAKVDAIYQKYAADLDKLGADISSKSYEIRAAYSQSNPEQSKIDSLLDERAKLVADMQKLRVKIDSEIRTALAK